MPNIHNFEGATHLQTAHNNAADILVEIDSDIAVEVECNIVQSVILCIGVGQHYVAGLGETGQNELPIAESIGNGRIVVHYLRVGAVHEERVGVEQNWDPVFDELPKR